MALFVFCIISGCWCIYNFVGYVRPEWMLPYFRIAGDESTILRVINMLCLNWSPFIGLMLIGFGVVCILVRRKGKLDIDGFMYTMVVVGFLYSIGLML